MTQSAVVASFLSGHIDRRSAVKQLFTLGLSATSAYAALGFPVNEAAAQAISTELQNTLMKNAEAMTKLVSSPEMIKAVDEASKETDKQKAAQTLVDSIYKPGILEKSGMSTEELRTSMRVFELDTAKGGENTLLQTRRVGSVGITRLSPDGRPLSISDKDQIDSAASQGSLLAKELKVQELAPPGANKGVCVSYGKDLCVSGGFP